ncbi:unnamed protein product [Polarella glacialis]|uniref:Uncharacterized protein n=1 Tax=Polarella glacialis TaxID=89957 RepID=A0A813GDE0_POLGL|nr:unnamed protein product [Polarella glacialis]
MSRVPGFQNEELGFQQLAQQGVSVLVQVCGRRESVVLEGLHSSVSMPRDALSDAIRHHFEVEPPFFFSDSNGWPLDDAEALSTCIVEGAVVVVRLSEGALHDLGRRVTQLRHLQWGLLSERQKQQSPLPQPQPPPVISATATAEIGLLREEVRELSGDRLEDLRQRLEAALRPPMERRFEAIEATLGKHSAQLQQLSDALAGPRQEQAAKDAEEQGKGQKLRQQLVAAQPLLEEEAFAKEDPSAGTVSRKDFEDATQALRAECGRIRVDFEASLQKLRADSEASLRQLRQECREAMQREVRSRLDRQRAIEEELHKSKGSQLLDLELRNISAPLVDSQASGSRGSSGHGDSVQGDPVQGDTHSTRSEVTVTISSRMTAAEVQPGLGHLRGAELPATCLMADFTSPPRPAPALRLLPSSEPAAGTRHVVGNTPVMISGNYATPPLPSMMAAGSPSVPFGSPIGAGQPRRVVETAVPFKPVPLHTFG